MARPFLFIESGNGYCEVCSDTRISSLLSAFLKTNLLLYNSKLFKLNPPRISLFLEVARTGSFGPKNTYQLISYFINNKGLGVLIITGGSHFSKFYLSHCFFALRDKESQCVPLNTVSVLTIQCVLAPVVTQAHHPQALLSPGLQPQP